MKRKTIALISAFALAVCFSLVFAAGEYRALNGVEKPDTLFDFRDGNPESALVHLKLVRDTYNDKPIQGLDKKPDFVVVFMGSSVKLLSSDRQEFTAEQKKTLDKMNKVITALDKDGIRMEVCSYAVDFFGVDPKTIPPEIERVGNGWISALGYQAMGYSLIPVY